MRSGTMIALLSAAAAMSVASAPAAAQQQRTYAFDLPAQDLGDALRAVTARAGWELYAAAQDVNGVPAPALHGQFTPREAIERLLRGTGLVGRYEKGAVIVRVGSATADVEQVEETTKEIVVTGSHIRGAEVAAPVHVVTRTEMENAGQRDLGEVVRSLPENFAGGQNPGVGMGAGLINSNLNSASNIDLLGLGPDATLTLLNGHRLPYDGAFSGVDVSTIPVQAVERIEIVTDGASAEYGSDAVAGVANVILRRDFKGIATSARIGAATDGGDVEEQGDLVAGATWSSGGVIATYNFSHNSGITAHQRDYASSLPDYNSLYPLQTHHAGVLSAHQAIGERAEFKIDGLFSHRRSTILGGNLDSAGLTRYHFAPTVQSFSLTPEVDIHIGRVWMVRASLAYGHDDSHYNTLITPPGAEGSRTYGCYCNQALTAEIVFDGSLFRLPGGSARAAVGGGFRSNGLHYTRYIDAAPGGAFDRSRKSHFLFAEAEFPLIGPAQSIPLVRRITISAAARYEDYPGLDQLVTPKLGLIYEPDANFSVKASWGRSFKAPTLYQQYVGYETYLLPAGEVGAAASGTILYTSGGNPDLKPERARNWGIGVEVHPEGIPSLKFGLRYFNIRYIDRVTQPIPGSIASAFSDPGYASLLTYDPSAEILGDLIAGSLYGLENYSGEAYAPGDVVALVDNRNRNVARQNIDGVNFDIAYQAVLSPKQSLSFQGSATYLQSNQVLTPELPTTRLAGTVFNPPHWRARVGATWTASALTLSGYANYIGDLEDARFAPPTTVHSMLTFDIIGRLGIGARTGDGSALDLTLAVHNLFNRKPDVIRTTGSSDTPFDSTNFSAIGRFVGLTVSRNW